MSRHLLAVSGTGSPTAAGFVANVNAALAGLTDKVVTAVQFHSIDRLPTAVRQLQAVIEYEDGGATMSAPFQVTVIASADLSAVVTDGQAYFAANPTSFIAPIQFQNTDQTLNASNEYLSFYFDCTDATNAAVNYQVAGGSAGGTVPGGNTSGALLYSTGTTPSDLTWLPQGTVGRFLKSTLTGLVYSTILATDVGYTPTTPGNWPSVPATVQTALDTLATQATGFLPLVGGTMTGLLITAPSAAGSASIRMQAGVDPSTPVDGDIWRTSTALKAQVGATAYDLTAPVRVNPVLATGLLKVTTGTGALATATAGTDYVVPGAVTTSGLTSATATLLGRTTVGTGAIESITVGSGLSLSGGVLSNSGAMGTVTSVALSAPAQFAVSGSPVTTAGTLTFAWNTQTANSVLAGPTSGGAAAPTFRTLVASDIPALAYVPAGDVTTSGLTMSTARLLGRTTAATGAIEEISAGAGLTLSGGVLAATATVTSVSLSAPAQFAVSGSPVTTIGTLSLAWNTQTANTILAGPTSGGAAAPTFRTLVASDIPSLSYAPTGAITASGLTVATARLLGRTTASTGAIEEISIGAGLTLSGGVLSNSGAVGTVTSVSVVTANGVSGSVATSTTTPAITLTLGAITPTSVAASGAVTGSNLSGSNTGDQTITLTGDVTGSGTGGLAATIAANAVTFAKFQQIATNSLLGRSTAATGNVEVITVGSGLSIAGGTLVATGGTGTVTSVSVVTANGVSGSVATATTTPAITLTLGAITPTSILASGTIVGSNVSGTNTGDQTISLTGDVTGSGTGSFAATIAANAVTFAKFQQIATGSLLGRSTAATGNVEVISVGSGLSLSGGVLSNTGAVGTVTSVSVVTANGVSGSVATSTTTPAITLTLGAITPTSVAASGTVTGSNLSGTNTGNQTITLTGDVTGSGTGSFAATIAANAVTLAKFQQIATNSLLGRSTAATGNIEVITVGSGLSLSGGVLSNAGASGTVTSVSVVTANGVSGSVATATTTPAITLTLGAITPTSVAASGTVTGSNLSGTNTGDQTITLTGDVTGSGTGSFAATIAAGAVSLSKMANLAANSFIGNNTGSAATPLALSGTQATALLNVFTTSLKGVVPASGGGSTNFLCADGTWSVPVGTGTIGGSIANTQIAVGSGSNTIAGSGALTFASGQVLLANGATAQTTPWSITGSINNFYELNLQNTSSGAGASSDLVLTADTGSASTQYIDIGVNGSGYTGAVMGSALEGYLYTSDQNLNIGAGAAAKVVRILAGGTTVGANTIVTVATAGVSVTGTLSATGSVTGSNLSGTNTGDQTITLTGDVTGSGTGSFAATIAANAVTLAKFQQIATGSLLGRSTAATGNVEVITVGSGLSLSGGTLSTTGSGTIGGSIADTQVAYGNGANAVTGAASFTYTTATSSLALSQTLSATATSASAVVTVSSTRAIGASGNTNQVGIQATATMTGGFTPSTSSVTGGSFSAVSNVSATFINTNVVGILASASHAMSSTGTIATMIGADISVTTGSLGGTLTGASYGTRIICSNQSSVPTVYGAFIQLAGGGGSTAITNRYGLWVENSGTPVISGVDYGVYQSTANMANVFAGNRHSFGLTALTAGSISHLGTAGIRTIQAATQDGVILLGRAGGTTSLFVTLTPGVLTSSITLTSPLASGTLTTGSGTVNQIASWSGTNAITGATTLTATVTSGATLFAHAAGTSTATTTTAAATHTVTFSGAATTGPMGGLSVTTTSTGTIATANIETSGIIGNVVANPGGAVAAVFYRGATISASNTSAANANMANATLAGALFNTTFNTANTTGVAVVTAVVGVKVVPSVVTTNASGTNTIANVYGLWVAPGTFSSTGGGGLTITNYYGLMIDTLTLTTMTVTNRYGVFQNDPAAQNIFNGDVKINTAGKTLFIKEGSNAKMGTAVLVAGTVTVSTTAITANSRVFLTSNVDGGTTGAVRVSARTAGTSFTITSLSGADTSTVAWVILEPA